MPSRDEKEPRRGGPRYDPCVPPTKRRPGLAKTSALPLLQHRQVVLWGSSDYRWRELFETADVMSEGAARGEREGEFYYGTTSVLLTFESEGGAIPDAQAKLARAVVRRDPHARVRAIRIACREAQVRAAAPLGRVRAELTVRTDPRGIRIDIDVEARLFPQDMRKPGAGSTSAGRLSGVKRVAR